jgi:cytochrome P450
VAVPRLAPPHRLTARGRARARVGRVLDDLVAARRAAPRPPDDPDLVDVLLGLGLTEPLLRGELTAFLLAAADEPPSALAAVWYLLGRHPEAERRVLEERDRVIGHRVPEPDDEARLPYLGAVIREALRLFPPARHIDRCPVHAVELGGTTVPAGTEVLVSPLVLHHDPRWFPDPSAFRPERWLDRPSSGPPRGAYLPFGAGAHACIGEPLARAITWITLVTVSRDWRLRVGPGAPPPVPRAPRLVVELERR